MSVLYTGPGDTIVEMQFPEAMKCAHDVFVRLHSAERNEAESSLYDSVCTALAACFVSAPLFAVEREGSVDQDVTPFEKLAGEDGMIDLSPGTEILITCNRCGFVSGRIVYPNAKQEPAQ